MESLAALTRQFTDWARAKGQDAEIEPDVVETVLTFKRDYLDVPEPRRWPRGALTEILLDWWPAKLTVDEEWIATVEPTLRLYAQFLDETASTRRQREDARRMAAELAEVGPKLPAAMADTSGHGMAKRLMAQVVADGVDPADPDALQGWMERFNRLPFEERRRRTDPLMGTGHDVEGFGPLDDGFDAEGFDDDEFYDDEDAADLFEELVGPVTEAYPPVDLPLVRFGSDAERAQAARNSPLMLSLVALAEWAGERKLTDTGVLRVADGRAAVVELGLITEEALAERESWGRLRSSRNLHALHWRWMLVGACGLLEARDKRSRPGSGLEAWKSDDDAAVLSTWLAAFDGLMRLGVAMGAERFAQLVVTDLLNRQVGGLMIAAYGNQAAVDRLLDAVSTDMARYSAFRGRDLGLDFATTFARNMLDDWLEQMEALGALRRRDGTVQLTDLGAWALWRRARELGGHLPGVGDAAELTAAALLETCFAFSDQIANELLREWASATGGLEEAARRLVEAASVGTTNERANAFVLLHRLGAGVEPAVRAVIDQPTLRPHALVLLQHLGCADVPELTDDERLWAVIDLMAAVPAEVTDDAAAMANRMPDLSVETIEGMWRIDHPDVAKVLELVGRTHPDRQKRKAARKAAFKARSRQAQR